MPRSLDRRLVDFLAIDDRPVAPLALALREIVLAEAAGAVETIFRNHPSALWFGYGPKMADMFCYVAMASRHVNLGFCQGATLPDPAGVLEGSGRAMRHVKFRTESDLERPFVRPYVRAASESFRNPQGWRNL